MQTRQLPLTYPDRTVTFDLPRQDSYFWVTQKGQLLLNNRQDSYLWLTRWLTEWLAGLCLLVCLYFRPLCPSVSYVGPVLSTSYMLCFCVVYFRCGLLPVSSALKVVLSWPLHIEWQSLVETALCLADVYENLTNICQGKRCPTNECLFLVVYFFFSFILLCPQLHPTKCRRNSINRNSRNVL